MYSPSSDGVSHVFTKELSKGDATIQGRSCFYQNNTTKQLKGQELFQRGCLPTGRDGYGKALDLVIWIFFRWLDPCQAQGTHC